MIQSLFPMIERLVSIPSVSSDKDALHECAKYIFACFDDYSQAVRLFIEHNNTPSIIIQNFSWKHADIILSWHFDVVPPSNERQYALIEHDGKLYGRWAWDMKSGVAVMITLMQHLLSQNYTDKKIMLMLTGDEEVWGFDGVGYLVSQGYRWDIILCPDGWSSIQHIVHAEKWIYMFDLAAHGISCHSSKPRLWNNAITTAIACANEIKKTTEEYDLAYNNKNHWWTTVNLNVIQGWTAKNVLPSSCTIGIDIRFTERYTSQSLVTHIHDIVKKYNCTLSHEFTWELLYTDPQNPILQRYKKIADKHLSAPTQREAEPGWSDCRFFAAVGSTIILHKPSSGNLHGEDERVIKDDINKLRDIFHNFIIEKSVSPL